MDPLYNSEDAVGKESSPNWMKKAFSKNHGKLHKRLGVPLWKKIPQAKLAQASSFDDPSLRKEAALAKTGKKYAGGGIKGSGKQLRGDMTRKRMRTKR